MGIDDLRFFLKVESFFMALDCVLLERVSVILLVIREDILGIGISNESVCAASLSSIDLLVASGQILERRSAPDAFLGTFWTCVFTKLPVARQILGRVEFRNRARILCMILYWLFN